MPPALDVLLEEAQEARDGGVFVRLILRAADDDLGPAQIERDLAADADAERLADGLGQSGLPLSCPGGGATRGE